MAGNWSVKDVSKWVKTLMVSDDHSTKFADAKINGKILPTINNKKLIEMGIEDEMDRREILKQIMKLCGIKPTPKHKVYDWNIQQVSEWVKKLMIFGVKSKKYYKSFQIQIKGPNANPNYNDYKMNLCGFNVFGNVKLLDYADEEIDKKIYEKDGIALQMNKRNKKNYKISTNKKWNGYGNPLEKITTKKLFNANISGKNGWIRISFDDVNINPTHYIITRNELHPLLHWTVSASVDDINYEVISQHKNDIRLQNTKPFETVKFKIEYEKKYYKSFEIKIIGPNSNTFYEDWKMNLCRFDIVGYVQLLNDDKSDEKTEEKKETQAKDTEILSVFSVYTINEFIFNGNINHTKIYKKLNIDKNNLTIIKEIRKHLVKLFDVNVLIADPLTDIYNYLSYFTKLINNLLNKSNNIKSKFIIIPNKNISLKTDKPTQKNNNKIIKNNYFKKIVIKKNGQKLKGLTLTLYKKKAICLLLDKRDEEDVIYVYDYLVDVWDDTNGILIFLSDTNKQETVMHYNYGFIRFFPEFLVSFVPYYFDTKSNLKTNDQFKDYYNWIYSHNIKHCCWLINKNKIINEKFKTYYKKLTGRHLLTNNYFRIINEYDYYNLNKFKCHYIGKCDYIEYLKSVLYDKNKEKSHLKITYCFGHIIEKHSNDIKKFNLIECKNKLNNCKYFATNIRDIENTENNNENDISIFDDKLASIHCYLLHPNHKIRMERYNSNRNKNDNMNKFGLNFDDDVVATARNEISLSNNEEKENSQPQTPQTSTKSAPQSAAPKSVPKSVRGELLDINLGIDFNEWDININNLKYNNISDEVTNKFNIHKYESITNKCFNKIKNECKNIYQSQNNKSFIYTINELISLKIYTDLTSYQYAFRRVFWKNKNNDVDLKNKREYFYNLTKQFVLTFIYGAIPQYNTMYHGLSRIFISDQINNVIFFGPISLTLVKNQADTFAKTNGIIWEIKMDHNKPLNLLLGIKTNFLSRFPVEEEVIFLNTRLPIIQSHIKSYDINENINLNENQKYEREKKTLLLLFNYLLDMNRKITNKIKFYKKIGCKINNINDYKDMILKDDNLYQLLFKQTKLSVENENVYLVGRLTHELELNLDVKNQLMIIFRLLINFGRRITSEMTYKITGCECVKHMNDYRYMIFKENELYPLLFKKTNHKNIIVFCRLLNEFNLTMSLKSFVDVMFKYRNNLLVPKNMTKELSKKNTNKIYNNIVIYDGGKLITKEKNGILKLQAKNIIKLGINSTIEVNGKGFKGASQRMKKTHNPPHGGGNGDITYNSVTTGGGGGAYFSHGKNGQDDTISGGMGGELYNNTNVLQYGSGGGCGYSRQGSSGIASGGSGGGIIFLSCNKLILEHNSKLISYGDNGTKGRWRGSGGGGGSGGVIYMKCHDILNFGLISVKGGKGTKPNSRNVFASSSGSGGYGGLLIDHCNHFINNGQIEAKISSKNGYKLSLSNKLYCFSHTKNKYIPKDCSINFYFIFLCLMCVYNYFLMFFSLFFFNPIICNYLKATKNYLISKNDYQLVN